MATDFNITMKQYNGVDYDTLYPKTILSQIEGMSDSYFNKNQILTTPTAAQFGLDSNAVPNDVFSFIGKYNEYWWKRVASSAIEYVHSTDRNAYPDSGIQDDYEYEYLGVPFENAILSPKAAILSYIGNGTYGLNNPCSVTCEFPPKLLLMLEKIDGTDQTAYIGSTVLCKLTILPNLLTTEYSSIKGFWYSNKAGRAKKSADGKTIYWYHTDSASGQMNVADSTYYLLAIG